MNPFLETPVQHKLDQLGPKSGASPNKMRYVDSDSSGESARICILCTFYIHINAILHN